MIFIFVSRPETAGPKCPQTESSRDRNGPGRNGLTESARPKSRIPVVSVICCAYMHLERDVVPV